MTWSAVLISLATAATTAAALIAGVQNWAVPAMTTGHVSAKELAIRPAAKRTVRLLQRGTIPVALQRILQNVARKSSRMLMATGFRRPKI